MSGTRSSSPRSVRSADDLRIERNRTFPVPLTIGVLSDTHIYIGSRPLSAAITHLFKRSKVDLILHGGDVNGIEGLLPLSEIAPLIVVAGNNDNAAVREIAPDEVLFTVGQHRFAMLHGNGGSSARSLAKRRFAGKVDCVIYGHSHKPMIELEESTIYFNPGSPTDRRWNPHFGVGLIRVTTERIAPELILYNNAAELDSVAFE